MPQRTMKIDEYRALQNKKVGKKRGEMNKTESDFVQDVLEPRRLAGVSVNYRYEPLTFRLPGGVKYTPDFMEEAREGKPNIFEVKGFWRPQDRQRVKITAAMFPMFNFSAAIKRKKKDGGGWKYEEF